MALGAAAVLAPGRLLAGPSDSPLYATARQREGRNEVVLIDEQGRDRQVHVMPDRGHSFALDAGGGRVTVFGRQPGFFAMAFDVQGRAAPQVIEASEGRHFFGHGVYLPGGQLMLATENDYEGGRGVLGIYDVSRGGNYKRVGEFDCAGIGPHEVVLMPDGRTLCVANGGILTHPDYGKLELNLDTMAPSLAYVDARSGELLEQVTLDPRWHRLSIRHLALDARGRVWFGCQHMGPAGERPALVGRHVRGEAPTLFAGPAEVLRDMRNYVGSVSADPAGRIIATSSPVGGQVLYWDADSGRQLGLTRLADGCGVAPHRAGGFLLSSGLGAMVHVAAPAGAPEALIAPGGQAWDNHFRRL